MTTTTTTTAREELFDLVDEKCKPLGITKARSLVHRDGDWHQAVHVWVMIWDTWEVVMQQRVLEKDSWPGMWDISSAGHISAGGEPLESAQREVEEELGLKLPKEAFRYLFLHKQEFEGKFHGKKFVNNEFNHVYLVTLKERLPREAFKLQKEEVRDMKFIGLQELGEKIKRGDKDHCIYLDPDTDSKVGWRCESV
ncbi:NUDIX hydrolase [Chloropicon primus]|uniref:NUDIX hydrolase n=1 Tax=Chloropicon primus TaxID=1764295 RepID=A0A5B8MII3_9CHLO|nr:NUDIX hydrolase [Chloropicon primus]|eukprot:QDZ20448.1 NUDIX hydrolase [Chloropicon primus]